MTNNCDNCKKKYEEGFKDGMQRVVVDLGAYELRYTEGISINGKKSLEECRDNVINLIKKHLQIKENEIEKSSYDQGCKDTLKYIARSFCDNADVSNLNIYGEARDKCRENVVNLITRTIRSETSVIAEDSFNDGYKSAIQYIEGSLGLFLGSIKNHNDLLDIDSKEYFKYLDDRIKKLVNIIDRKSNERIERTVIGNFRDLLLKLNIVSISEEEINKIVNFDKTIEECIENTIRAIEQHYAKKSSIENKIISYRDCVKPFINKLINNLNIETDFNPEIYLEPFGLLKALTEVIEKHYKDYYTKNDPTIQLLCSLENWHNSLHK